MAVVVRPHPDGDLAAQEEYGVLQGARIPHRVRVRRDGARLVPDAGEPQVERPRRGRAAAVEYGRLAQGAHVGVVLSRGLVVRRAERRAVAGIVADQVADRDFDAPRHGRLGGGIDRAVHGRRVDAPDDGQRGLKAGRPRGGGDPAHEVRVGIAGRQALPQGPAVVAEDGRGGQGASAAATAAAAACVGVGVGDEGVAAGKGGARVAAACSVAQARSPRAAAPAVVAIGRVRRMRASRRRQRGIGQGVRGRRGRAAPVELESVGHDRGPRAASSAVAASRRRHVDHGGGRQHDQGDGGDRRAQGGVRRAARAARAGGAAATAATAVRGARRAGRGWRRLRAG